MPLDGLERMSDRPEVFTPKTLAQRWNCSERHIRKMIENGELQAFRVGKLVRIRRDVVEERDPARPPTEIPDMVPKISDAFSYPPRGMSREEAARYVGVGTTKFDELVADRRMPNPKRIDGRVVWDRTALDAAFTDLPSDSGNRVDEILSRGGGMSEADRVREKIFLDSLVPPGRKKRKTLGQNNR